MKYIKSYNDLNEGLRNKMKPKTGEEIIELIKDLPLNKLLEKLQYQWITKMGNIPGSGKMFSDFVKGVTGRDIWEELKQKYINDYKDENLLELNMRYDHSASNLIYNSNLSKDDVIKLLIKLLNIKNI